jgi:hypothetical protein
VYARWASKKKYIEYWQTCQYSHIYLYSCFFISSNVLFIQPLAFCRNWEQRRWKNCITRHNRASTNDGLPKISKMKYRNQISGTTISGFVDSKKKKWQPDPRFFWHVTVNTHFFYFGLTVTWSVENKWK